MYFTPTKDENRSYAAACLAGIAVTQKEIGLAESAGDSINRALEVARGVEGDSYRSRALQAIAVARAKLGDYTGAAETLREITIESNRSAAQTEIALEQARCGAGIDAVRTAEGILVERGKALQSLAEAFAELGDRQSLKRLLVSGSQKTVGAYRLCLLLARLYQQQLPAVVGAIVKAQDK